MEDTVAAAASSSRFELAPPRNFILPAVLLLLSERPGYGYGLVPRMEELRFGHVDRPAIYRALVQLERDRLVEASSQSPTAGQARRVYRITPRGERTLRIWMGVIKEEHEHLGKVLRRYQATGTTDAVLAEVEGGWASALGFGWSAVSSTSPGRRTLASVGDDGTSAAPNGPPVTGPVPTGPVPTGPSPGPSSPEGAAAGSGPLSGTSRSRFRLVPDRSVVLIEVRSTVGPLSFGAIGITGTIEAAVDDGVLRTEIPPIGRLEVDVTRFSSGNHLYDAELQRRIDARRFPTAAVELRECTATGPGSRYRLEGELTFHGVTRPAQGTVTVEAVSERRLVIAGEQVFDIRDFTIPSPTVLMLRIYPDARVRLHAEAEREEAV